LADEVAVLVDAAGAAVGAEVSAFNSSEGSARSVTHANSPMKELVGVEGMVATSEVVSADEEGEDMAAVEEAEVTVVVVPEGEAEDTVVVFPRLATRRTVVNKVVVHSANKEVVIPSRLAVDMANREPVDTVNRHPVGTVNRRLVDMDNRAP